MRGNPLLTRASHPQSSHFTLLPVTSVTHFELEPGLICTYQDCIMPTVMIDCRVLGRNGKTPLPVSSLGRTFANTRHSRAPFYNTTVSPPPRGRRNGGGEKVFVFGRKIRFGSRIIHPFQIPRPISPFFSPSTVFVPAFGRPRSPFQRSCFFRYVRANSKPERIAILGFCGPPPNGSTLETNARTFPPGSSASDQNFVTNATL